MADSLAHPLHPLAEPLTICGCATSGRCRARRGYNPAPATGRRSESRSTSGEPTHTPPETRRAQTEAATAVLGMSWRGNSSHQSLARGLAFSQASWRPRPLRPRIIFAPYWEDSHPDHVRRVRLDAALFGPLSKTDTEGIISPTKSSTTSPYTCAFIRLLRSSWT